MINVKNYLEGTFFVCDECGREFTFVDSWLCVKKGEEFRPAGGEILIAEKDLCRYCAGQMDKLPPGGAEMVAAWNRAYTYALSKLRAKE